MWWLSQKTSSTGSNTRGKWVKESWCTDDLKFDSLALKLNCADLEIDTDSTNVAFGVRVVGKT